MCALAFQDFQLQQLLNSFDIIDMIAATNFHLKESLGAFKGPTRFCSEVQVSDALTEIRIGSRFYFGGVSKEKRCRI
jgi:hypothetical protein